MKKLIYLLIFLPVIAQAQNWQVGLCAGFSANTKLDEFIESNNTKMSLSGAMMISASRRLNSKFEIGLALTAVDLARVANSITIYGNGPTAGTYHDAHMHMGKVGMLITPYASWHLHYFYLGAQAGYFTSINGENDFSGKYAQLYYNDFKGFCLGIHAGHDWPVIKSLLISAEIRANYIEANLKNAYGFNTIQGAFLVGAKYAFGFPKTQYPTDKIATEAH